MFGVAHGIPSVFLTKVIASTKPDFIWIDVEHGMFNRLTLHDAIHAAQHHSEGKTMVIVRVPKGDEISLTTALDAGAAGIMIPHCESAEEVQALIKEMYYPPMGHRSFSPWTFTPGISSASLYQNDLFNIETSNRHVAVIAQIESVKGVENVDAIAAVPGVSALMFGPGDFMTDAGLPLKLGGIPHPVFADALEKFAAAGKKNNIPLMGAAQQLELIPMLLEQGYRLIITAFDVWNIAGMVYEGLAKGKQYVKDIALPMRESNGSAIEKNGTAIEAKGSAIESNGAAVEANGTTKAA
ncbi:HpcH/HpaI aldolase [Microthyrium microscopicum]|uniref:HpcH/HpaI aldolase n=1 Tax=Microthyrium microscopicum TaxID=703497 RepID=A0A6A6TTN7_9PEZI|nr:HpcH/HpaI aldolase [Microthyrium microscopicum]